MVNDATALQMFRDVGMTDRQIGQLLTRAAGVQQPDFAEALYELADRLAANGMTDDLSAHWGRRLSALDLPNALGDWKTETVADLQSAGPIPSPIAAKMARDLYGRLHDLANPPDSPTMIDTTATIAADDAATSARKR
jgi:hypothetical protein